MFETIQVENRQNGTRSWSVAGSLMLQSLLVGLLILVPLISARSLPETKWLGFLVAPPPPAGADRPPAAEEPAVASRVVSRVDASILTTPTKIPDKVAILVDRDGPPAAVTSESGVALGVGVPGGVPGGILLLGERIPEIPPPPQPAAPQREAAAPPRPVPVGGQVQAAKLIHRVRPVYPLLAKQARISGVVRLEAIIAADGTIRELRVVRGHPLLIESALAAVRQWRYRPTLLNSRPVEVVTHIDVRYSLQR